MKTALVLFLQFHTNHKYLLCEECSSYCDKSCCESIDVLGGDVRWESSQVKSIMTKGQHFLNAMSEVSVTKAKTKEWNDAKLKPAQQRTPSAERRNSPRNRRKCWQIEYCMGLITIAHKIPNYSVRKKSNNFINEWPET